MLILSLLVLTVTTPVLAWDGHDVITQEALKGLKELLAYDSIEITPYTYDSLDPSEYNPEFELEFKLGEIGDKVSAFDILVTYAPEPDWDLDENLELSSKQKLTGGSQGYRHQRYTLISGLVVFGVAPERAQHFYDLALTAYEKGDLYWAFRFLARSLHYLQDMGMPLHALPLPIGDLVFKYGLDIGKATTVGSNVHYSVEAFIKYHQGKEDSAWRLAMAQAETADIGTSLEKFAEKENMASRKKAESMYRQVLAIWPQLESAEKVRITEPEDFEEALSDERVRALWSLVQGRLVSTASSTKGLVTQFFADIK